MSGPGAGRVTKNWFEILLRQLVLSFPDVSLRGLIAGGKPSCCRLCLTETMVRPSFRATTRSMSVPTNRSSASVHRVAAKRRHTQQRPPVRNGPGTALELAGHRAVYVSAQQRILIPPPGRRGNGHPWKRNPQAAAALLDLAGSAPQLSGQLSVRQCAQQIVLPRRPALE